MRAIDRLSRLQPSHEIEPRIAALVSHLLRTERHRRPHVGRFARGFAGEPRWRDADDRERQTVDRHGLANGRRGATEPATPIVVTDHRHGRQFVVGREHATKRRPDIQPGEIVAGDLLHERLVDVGADADGHSRHEGRGDEVRQRSSALAQRQIVGVREIPSGRAVAHRHQPFGMADGQRPQQRGIDHRKDRGIGADAEPQ